MRKQLFKLVPVTRESEIDLTQPFMMVWDGSQVNSYEVNGDSRIHPDYVLNVSGGSAAIFNVGEALKVMYSKNEECDLCGGKGNRYEMEFDGYNPTGKVIYTECVNCKGTGIRHS